MKILSLIWRKAAALILTAMLLSVIPVSGLTENDSFTEDPRYDVDFNRWGSATDRMDEYLDLAFELYLAGDTHAAFDCINNAYFSVYEATGFEQQTAASIVSRRSWKTACENLKTILREAAEETGHISQSK